VTMLCKTCFSSLLDDYVYCPYCGEPTGKGDDRFQYNLSLEEARAFAVLGRFSDAARIYKTLMNDEPKDVYCLIGLVRVASKNFTVYDDPKVEESISCLDEITRGNDLSSFDSDYNAFIAARARYMADINGKRRAEEAEKKRLAAERQRREEEKRRAEEIAKAERERAERERAEKEKREEEKRRRLEEEKRREAEQRASDIRRNEDAEMSVAIAAWSAEQKNASALADARAKGFVITGTALMKYTGNESAVVIPHFITGIADSAFSHNSYVKTVYIPKYVGKISKSSFSFMPALEKILVESGNTTYKSVGYGVVDVKNHELVHAGSCCVIPDDGSVTSIGEFAFWGCGSLKEISIPKSIKSIGNFSFAGCSGLTSVTIPDSVSRIGSHSFYCCYNLKYVSIPSKLAYSPNTFPEGARFYKRA